MKKAKTKKLITKRLKITKTGKVLRRQGFARHLSTKKSRKKLAALRKPKLMEGKIVKKIKKLIPKKAR